MIFDLTEALEVTSNTSVEEVELEALATDLPDGEVEALQRQQVRSCRWVVAMKAQEAHFAESQSETLGEIEEGAL